MMEQKAKNAYRIVVGLLAVVLLLSVAFSTKSQLRKTRLSWPRKEGVYIAKSSETIPAFPRALSGYRSENNKDFWGKAFECEGTIRVFGQQGWTGIPDFPNTMNHCSAGVFMIRWRSANPGGRIASTYGYSTDNPSASTKIGSFGYMSGTNCEEPLFKFVGPANNLEDIYYELKFWQAAP